jgi:hypothetical protein
MPKDPIRQAAGRKGKRKGSSFERKIAKSLEDFWGSPFTRVPQSGGHRALKTDFEICGDVATPDPTFRFNIECKNQECYPGLHVLLEPDNKGTDVIRSWWDQAVGDCPPHRWPILIMTRKYYPVHVMFMKDMLPPGPFPKSVPLLMFKWRQDAVRCATMTLESFLMLGKGYWSTAPARTLEG